eukprot:CAMPEP_0174693830 /NCGR_PEP_ID=MMETSP1094-20130205/469_1 /TAXON_ID=156173 /ORGANISM="Chrysochromulina brevifilum, Strain UTEX LB 985" /LENGTH=51 /DNA_ID=CAMNT_0015889851 /DNA_START=102 /DNA_END=253 /DNA_ORIENTATION=-
MPREMGEAPGKGTWKRVVVAEGGMEFVGWWAEGRPHACSASPITAVLVIFA